MHPISPERIELERIELERIELERIELERVELERVAPGDEFDPHWADWNGQIHDRTAPQANRELAGESVGPTGLPPCSL
jgi:hypothetical protein